MKAILATFLTILVFSSNAFAVVMVYKCQVALEKDKSANGQIGSYSWADHTIIAASVTQAKVAYLKSLDAFEDDDRIVLPFPPFGVRKIVELRCALTAGYNL